MDGTFLASWEKVLIACCFSPSIMIIAAVFNPSIPCKIHIQKKEEKKGVGREKKMAGITK